MGCIVWNVLPFWDSVWEHEFVHVGVGNWWRQRVFGLEVHHGLVCFSALKLQKFVSVGDNNEGENESVRWLGVALMDR